MAAQSPLRRWKPFFAAFDLVDAGIEAAGPARCRDEVQSVRGDVVERLCGVRAGDNRKAEGLCALLDGFMAESLLTLQAVPAEAVPRVLASPAELAKAVGALRRHQSERVRGLACDVVRGWGVAVRASATMEQLNGACRVEASEASRPLPKKIAPVALSHGPRTVKTRTPITNPVSSLHKRTPAPSVGVTRVRSEQKMEDTKRKLREGYREVEDAKRQRKIQVIQVIQAPKVLELKVVTV